ncbi:MAG: hypothetical protein AB9897_02365 [Anaerolineaceae bacterium]
MSKWHYKIIPALMAGLFLFSFNPKIVFAETDKTDKATSSLAIWLNVDDCTFDSPDPNLCSGTPKITFIGDEISPENSIIRIYGSLGNSTFNCGGSSCSFWLTPTDMKGQLIKFQGDSSDGTSTKQFTALIRIIKQEGVENSYSVEVVSSQWQGASPASCADIWQVLPEAPQLPDWLSTPNESSDLHSSDKLYYLAAAMINNHLVDASSCTDGGLSSPTTANECGVNLAEPLMLEWQNQFDTEILSIARTDSIPANLIKNIFLRESQFWPGTYHDLKEVGLGQLTENGADTVLLWNKDFYNEFCPTVLDGSTCDIGFGTLNLFHRQLLKGSLLTNTDATCAECQNGIDFQKANYSIHVFAETLRANCSQVNQIIQNSTSKSPREVSSYSDLWRFTLVNYNAGAGCLGDAITKTWQDKSPIDWAHVNEKLDPTCKKSIDYVDDISKQTAGYTNPLTTPTPSTTTTTITPEATQDTSPNSPPVQ